MKYIKEKLKKFNNEYRLNFDNKFFIEYNEEYSDLEGIIKDIESNNLEDYKKGLYLEITNIIKDLKVDEFMLIDLERDFKYYGVDNIPWDIIEAISGLEYDDGYGLQYWGGWITFKDSSMYLTREEYDGSEWWSKNVKPKLGNLSDGVE